MQRYNLFIVSFNQVKMLIFYNVQTTNLIFVRKNEICGKSHGIVSN